MMKKSKTDLKIQVFFQTSLTFALLSFLSITTVLCVSFYFTRTSEERALAQDSQLILNRLAQSYRETTGISPLHTDIYNPFLYRNSRERILLYENDRLLCDSFPIQSNTQSNTDIGSVLSSECTTELNNTVYRLESFKDISPQLHDTMTSLYVSLPICLAISMCAGFIMSCLSTVLKNGLIQTSEFLNYVSENSYPPPLMPCGPKELDELFEASNHLSDEIKSNLSNYKDAIDAFIHEIKTPLTAIIGYSEMIKNSNNISPEDMDSVEYITTESQRLNILTRKIIYFLSIDKQKTQWSKLDINAIIESAILSTRSRARINNISVEYNTITDSYMYGDEELLITCIVNILENAIKASSYGSKVIIHARTELNAVSQLSIQDFGKGIPKNELTKIFQPFYMLHKGSGIDNGLGLGLAICNSIANAHHSSITVTSEVGSGTTVEIKLPVDEYQQRFTREHAAEDKDSTLYILPSQP